MKGAKTILAAAIPFLSGTTASACPECRPFVDAGVYNSGFAANLAVLLLPAAFLSLIGTGIYYMDSIAAKWRKSGGDQP